MKRLLFLSPGNNLAGLGVALETLRAETSEAVDARSLLLYQVPGDAGSLEVLRQEATRADVVLFDLRTGGRVAETLAAIRAVDPHKTFVPLMGGSMEILALCRMRSFTFDRAVRGGGGSVDFRKIQQITTVIDKLGGVLPVGALRHARNWVHVVRYWTAGGEANLVSLLRLVAREYLGLRVPRPSAPLERPTHRLAHPRVDRAFASVAAWRQAHPPDPRLPTVAVLYYGGLHREASAVGAAALLDAFQGKANVLPIATDGVQSLDAVKRFLLGDDAPTVDGLVNLMWFRLDGGPMGGRAEDTLDALTRLDVPYVVPIALYDREVGAWQESAEGVSPVETYASVVLPELDGAQGPVPVLAQERSDADGFQSLATRALPDRVDRVAERLLAWIRLRRTPREQRRVAVVVYDYPPGPGNAGNASYLDVSRSVSRIMARLAAEGYRVEGLPPDPLKDLLEAGLHNGATTEPWRGERLGTPDYLEAWARYPDSARQAVLRDFGAPPGRILVDPAGLRVPGRWFGNVFLGFQPARLPGDELAAAHDRTRPPHHQYLAFYEYLKQAGADVVLHVGTHGTVEFTPGKELALSGACFPDLMQGAIPQVYLYTVSNPSEASLAKRRWQAVLVTHHLPDFIPAELYGDYQQLLDDLERFRESVGASGGARQIPGSLAERAEALHLRCVDADQLEDELRRLQAAVVPDGLHVFGTPKDGRGLARWTAQLLKRDVAGLVVAERLAARGPDASDDALLAHAHGFVSTGALPRELRRALDRTEAVALEKALSTIGRSFLADDELPGLLRALDGRFVPPGLMGDPLRSPEVYPTGRNGHPFDPTRIPFPEALERGALLGQALLARHVAATGHPPAAVSLVLWGFETARSGGETVGQLLYLVGARRKDKPGWLPSFEPVPLAELGRPRVDVALLMCGFFRDLFPTLVRDLDELLRQIAALDEPLDANALRRHVLADVAAGVPCAAARLFGPAPGQYGTDLPERVDASTWRAEAELGDAFEGALSFAYGADGHGTPAARALRARFEQCEVVSQVIDGAEYKIGDLDHYYEFLGGATRAVANRRGEAPVVLVGDTSGPRVRLEDPADEIRRFAVTRLLNPRWIEGMLRHGFHGVKKIEERVTNLVGLCGTVGVPSWVFDRVHETYVADAEMLQRLQDASPHATFALARRLGEAHRRGQWKASPAQLDELRRGFARLDADLEERSPQ